MVIIEPEAAMAGVGEAMNLLNGVAERFPDAISLAAGRPADGPARLTDLDGAVARFVGDRSDRMLWQYGPTAGLLPGFVAEVLRGDEGIAVDPAEVILSTGAQEAMFLVVAALFGPGDVLLVPDPIYVGITGAAAAARVPIAPLDADALDADALTAAVDAIAATGRRARALYLVPDFQNPLGSTLDLDRRRALLAVARARGLWLIEDSPYRIFDFETPPPPTLAALDAGGGAVIHLGSFAKALCPGLRLGFIAWPGAPRAAIERLLCFKSFVTVNTSPITQAIAAGTVPPGPDGRPSLRAAGARARALYRVQRDALLAGLDAALAGVPGVRWSKPAGGFFCRVDLPFDFDDAAFTRCAEDYRVIVCPMSMFSPTGGWRRTVRLGFSAAGPAALTEGAARFGAFVRDAIDERAR